jgi:hypothetical protein
VYYETTITIKLNNSYDFTPYSFHDAALNALIGAAQSIFSNNSRAKDPQQSRIALG